MYEDYYNSVAKPEIKRNVKHFVSFEKPKMSQNWGSHSPATGSPRPEQFEQPRYFLLFKFYSHELRMGRKILILTTKMIKYEILKLYFIYKNKYR